MREVVFKSESFSDRARKNLSILDTIRRVGPISKTEISSLIGVNVVTVSNYVEELLRQGRLHTLDRRNETSRRHLSLSLTARLT